MQLVHLTETQATGRFDEARDGRVRARIAERDADDAGPVDERRRHIERLGDVLELALDAVRRRAKADERMGELAEEELAFEQRCAISRNSSHTRPTHCSLGL